MKISLTSRSELASLAIQEAFVTLLPYFIISSVGTLFFQGIIFLNINPSNMPINSSIKILRDIFPLLLTISIAYHTAKLYEIDRIIPILLAFTLLISINVINNGYHDKILNLNCKFLFYALLIPCFSTALFANLVNSAWLKKPKYTSLGRNLTLIYQYCPAFIICYIISICLFLELTALINILLTRGHIVHFIIPSNLLIFIQAFITALLDFFGVHGTNVFELFVSNSFSQDIFFSNISIENFSNLFSHIGGAGCSLPLAITMLFSKDKHAQTIAKIALPFAIFNISEILVFGIPIIFNWRLFWPFITLPTLNIIITYGVLQTGFITSLSEHNLPWTTPPLISGYLASDGDFKIVLLQTLLIVIDILIYLPFVKNYTATQSTSKHLASLEKTLKITRRTQAREAIKFQKAQAFIVKSHIETHDIIELITRNELLVFYQPKVKTTDDSCDHFEALLRLRLENGTIMSPYFLETLEQAGLAPVIDLWVCDQVSIDMHEWQKENFYPHISVNLHPDTLQESESVQKIITALRGLDIEFEIIERAFLGDARVKKNIALLQSNGFSMAIDDFGSGYSSLESLCDITASVIKIDKSLVDNINTERGYIIFCSASRMCKDLGFTLVVEGVETNEQMLVAKASGADYIQGWYYSPALPGSHLHKFSASCSSYQPATVTAKST